MKQTGTAALLLLFLATVARADVVSTAELCRRGDASMCRAAELEKKIDLRLFDRDSGRYEWQAVPPGYTERFLRNAEDRAMWRAAELCTQIEKVWISRDVDEYARLMALIPVDRAAYGECVRNASRNYIREERKQLLFRILEIAAVVAASLIAIAAFWYRRPLGRAMRNPLGRINRVGAK
jgi:hypothetical protein